MTRSGKILHFADSVKIEILLHIMSDLQVSVNNNNYCTISEIHVHHFVTQSLILPILHEGGKIAH